VSDPDGWLRIGSEQPLQVMVLGPLFEEHNRTRRALVQMARALDDRGVGTIFPDLAGTGESLEPIVRVSIARWHQEAAEAARLLGPTVIASMRGGSLIDDTCRARGWWRFSPETGARIVRDLKRTRLAGASDLYGGHSLSTAFLDDLESAVPAAVAPLRVVRLASETSDADALIDGSPLWRRAEPGEDKALSAALAADLADWVRRCAVS
jgi:hypothetical protein